HIFRLFSFYFFYVAIIETGLQRPYDILYRELRESEEKYRSLFENLNAAGILIEPVFDRDGRLADLRYLMANPAVKKHLGKSPEELVGRLYSEVFSYPGRNPVFDMYENVLISGEPFRAELFLPASGRYVDISAYRPEPGRLALVFSDISDRKQAEDRLRESEERLRLAQVAGNVGVWELNPLDQEVRWSPELEAIYGMEPGSVRTYQDFQKLIHPDDRAMVDAERDKAIERRKPFEFEFRILRPGGETGWVYCRGGSAGGESGQPVRVFGVNIDITARKRIEEALRESEERFRTIAETLPVLISLSSTEDSTILFTNTAYNTAFGFSSGEIIGWKGPDVYYDPTDRTKMIEAIRQQGFVSNYRLKAKRADGTPLWLLSSVRPILYNGKPAIIGASIDITEQERAEDALRESEEKYRTIVETANEGIWAVDADLKTSFVNERMAQMLGYRPEEMIGRTAFDFMDEEGRAATEERLGERRRGKKGSYEHKYIRKDGSAVWTIANVSPLMGTGNRFLGSVGMLTDITERKRAETALQNTIRLLEDVMEGGPSPIFLKDLEGKFISINSALERMLGKSRMELKGKTDYDIAPKEQADYWRNHDKKIIETGHAIQVEEEADLPDGHHIFLANKFPLVDTYGRIYGVGAISHDITESKKAEEALRNSEATLEAFFDASPGILNIEDDQFRYVKTDRTTPTYFGLNRTTIVGRSVQELAPDFIRDYGEMMRGVIDTGKPVLNIELQNPVPSRPEELTYWQASYFPVPLPGGGRGIGIMGVDITARRKAEEELRKALAEKEVLLSEIHHRVKNNLTAFISLLSLEGSTDDTPAGKMLRQDLQNRARSMALVHETLYRTHSYDEVDMGMYLTNLLEQITRSFTTTRAVKTVVDAHGIMLDIPRATPAGLIINEIVTNSFKYAFPASFDAQAARHAPPTISIALTKSDGEYLMTVKDNGIGLPPGFDLATTQTLGLKLVNFLGKHQMRAKTEVRSENGTEFIFRFRE
ncbi:MAG TPA: PAS domain S-box protein, partial [Methanoregula sp.]|nr:PAS domain S-box protein [Methanoregula sp.]